jgi:hypothetical protein
MRRALLLWARGLLRAPRRACLLLLRPLLLLLRLLLLPRFPSLPFPDRAAPAGSLTLVAASKVLRTSLLKGMFSAAVLALRRPLSASTAASARSCVSPLLR